VTLRLAGRSVVTDATGRFLLVHETLPTGWHTLFMDGRTANGRGATYGTFEVAVRVTAGRTTVLPFTSWMPKIDVAHAVRIPSPTTTETVITTPLIPGLELRLPAGTVITDEDGRIVHEVSITPIPVDRPPFPLPAGVDVPIYFTIQPGGAYVAVTGTTRRGARLIYPNYRGEPAGGDHRRARTCRRHEQHSRDSRWLHGEDALVAAQDCNAVRGQSIAVRAHDGYLQLGRLTDRQCILLQLQADEADHRSGRGRDVILTPRGRHGAEREQHAYGQAEVVHPHLQEGEEPSTSFRTSPNPLSPKGTIITSLLGSRPLVNAIHEPLGDQLGSAKGSLDDISPGWSWTKSVPSVPMTARSSGESPSYPVV